MAAIFGGVSAYLVQTALTLRYEDAPLVVSPESILIPEVKQGDSRTVSVSLRNRGGTTIIIGDVVSGCGCTLVEIAQTEIPPGGESTLSLTWDVGVRRGETMVDSVIKYHIVDSQSDEQRFVVFRLTADVKPQMVVQPAVLRFSPNGGQQSCRMEVKRGGSWSTGSLVAVAANHESLSATMVTSDRHRGFATVDVSFDPRRVGDSFSLLNLSVELRFRDAVQSQMVVPVEFIPMASRNEVWRQ